MFGTWRIASEGWGVLALFGAATIILSLIYLPLGCVALGVMLWLSFILRVPHRVGPDAIRAVVAPADGRVVEIAEAPYPNDDSQPALRVSIAIGMADMQLQLCPVAGRVRDNFHVPGLFGYTDDRAQMRRFNERREITLETDGGHLVLLVQYGGRTARRLVCRFQEGKYLARGAPLGMAPMAGVVDLYLPANLTLSIGVDRRVIAGETVIAQMPTGKSRSGRMAAPLKGKDNV